MSGNLDKPRGLNRPARSTLETRRVVAEERKAAAFERLATAMETVAANGRTAMDSVQASMALMLRHAGLAEPEPEPEGWWQCSAEHCRITNSSARGTCSHCGKARP